MRNVVHTKLAIQREQNEFKKNTLGKEQFRMKDLRFVRCENVPFHISALEIYAVDAERILLNSFWSMELNEVNCFHGFYIELAMKRISQKTKLE